jgi:hypothetical protein
MIISSNNETYLTYLKKNKLPFDIQKLNIDLQNKSSAFINKPARAFWGSPTYPCFGWKEWCEVEQFDVDKYDWDNPVFWRLKKGSKVLQINRNEVTYGNTYLKPYITNPYKHIDINIQGLSYLEEEIVLDFEKILQDDIVAVQLMDGGIGHGFNFLTNPYERMFNSWDCESIVVLDKSKIEIIKEN